MTVVLDSNVVLQARALGHDYPSHSPRTDLSPIGCSPPIRRNTCVRFQHRHITSPQQNEMLTFAANETVSSIEHRLKQLKDGSDVEELHVTPNIREFNPGAEVALFQLLLTWAAFSTSKTVRSQVPRGVDSESFLLNLVECDYALVALMGAKAVKNASDADISLPAARIAQNELSKDRPPFSAHDRAHSASLIVGHASLAPASYAPYLDLATKGERAQRCQVFGRHLNHRLHAFYGATSSVPLFGRTSDLPSILYELFANAEEWGCTNLRNEPVKLPLRGILLRIHKVPSQTVTLDDPLSTFIGHLVADPECRYALEVSVFDSGVGLAQRHLREVITTTHPIDREFEAIKSCLAKHTSSSGSSSRGLGLHHVMDLTSRMKGFLRLRTGNLHLCRNFRKDPYFFAETRQEEKIVRGKMLEGFQFLTDWENASQTTATAQPYVKGAVFTLILPMREAQPTLL